MAKLVSKTYGEALFAIAMECGETEGIEKAAVMLEEIMQIREILKQNPDFDKLMKHPGIPKQEKLQVMKSIFDGRVSSELTGFLEIVVQKERYGALQSIFDYFANRVKEVKKIGVAFVTTAIELSDAQKVQVQERLLQTTSYLTMEMHYTVDASLIGGMVIRINDKVVDSSISNKLSRMKRQLLQIQLG